METGLDQGWTLGCTKRVKVGRRISCAYLTKHLQTTAPPPSSFSFFYASLCSYYINSNGKSGLGIYVSFSFTF